MAGIVTVIIIITFCMSFAIYLGTGQGTMFTNMLGMSGQGGSLWNNFIILLTVTAVASIGVGLFTFPNPYLIFSGITVFILGFLTLPIDLLTSTAIPSTLKLFIGGVFGIMYIMGTLGWFHGGETP